MSFAKDDLTVASVSGLKRTDIVRFENNKYFKHTSDPIVKEQKTEEFVLSENFDEQEESNRIKLEKLQKDYNSEEVKLSNFKEINSILNKTEELVAFSSSAFLAEEDKSKIASEIAQNLKDVDSILEQADFNGQKLFEEESKELSVVKEQIDPKLLENIENFSEKIQESKKYISERQQELEYKKYNIVEEVTSRVELANSVDTLDYAITEEGRFEQLKDEIKENFKINPSKKIKVQITSLNKDMILAMLSLRV